MMPIEITAAARSEYVEAYDWYLQRSGESARNFERVFQAALDRIGQAPHRLPFVDRMHQICLMERFPYQVIYRVKKDLVQVVAVAHAKRRPMYWQRRT